MSVGGFIEVQRVEMRDQGRIDGAQELAERHRPHVKILDTPDRHGEGVIRKGELQQGTGSEHGELGPILVEIPHREQRVRRSLHLVQKEDGAGETDPAQSLQLAYDATGVEALEHLVQVERSAPG